MMSEKEAALIPFHAVNEFMRPDFRMSVVRSTLNGLAELPEEHRHAIDRLTKKSVKIPGFRNSGKAPSALKAGPIAQTFEKNPELVASILAAWAELHAPLRKEVFELLDTRGWDLLPLQADRKKLPGFFTTWPKVESFESLNQDYTEKHPDSSYNSDEVSLMIVWVSARLPYELIDEEPQAVTKLSGLDKIKALMEREENESPSEG
jgi:hypothetical protein